MNQATLSRPVSSRKLLSSVLVENQKIGIFSDFKMEDLVQYLDLLVSRESKI